MRGCGRRRSSTCSWKVPGGGRITHGDSSPKSWSVWNCTQATASLNMHRLHRAAGLENLGEIETSVISWSRFYPPPPRKTHPQKHLLLPRWRSGPRSVEKSTGGHVGLSSVLCQVGHVLVSVAPKLQLIIKIQTYQSQ